MTTILTPIHALPYPDGAERVMDGDNAIGALAVAVDRELEEVGVPGVIVQNSAVQAGLGSASPIKLALNSVLLGPASWFVDASDWIQVPAGQPDAMYAVEAYGTVANVAPAILLSAFIYYGSTGAPAVIAGQSIYPQGASASHWSISTTVRLQAGQIVAVYASNPVADVGDWQVLRLTVRRILERVRVIPEHAAVTLALIVLLACLVGGLLVLSGGRSDSGPLAAAAGAAATLLAGLVGFSAIAAYRRRDR